MPRKRERPEREELIPYSRFLTQLLEDRGFYRSDLARASSLAETTLSQGLNRQFIPDGKTIYRIALGVHRLTGEAVTTDYLLSLIMVAAGEDPLPWLKEVSPPTRRYVATPESRQRFGRILQFSLARANMALQDLAEQELPGLPLSRLVEIALGTGEPINREELRALDQSLPLLDPEEKGSRTRIAYPDLLDIVYEVVTSESSPDKERQVG